MVPMGISMDTMDTQIPIHTHTHDPWWVIHTHAFPYIELASWSGIGPSNGQVIQDVQGTGADGAQVMVHVLLVPWRVMHVSHNVHS